MRGAERRRTGRARGDPDSARRNAVGLLADDTLRVVVAEDEPAALSGLARRLGATPSVRVVAACRNGIEALERIRATRPDAAFLDVAMPGLAGLDVVRALDLADRPHIVFVTAYDDYAVGTALYPGIREAVVPLCSAGGYILAHRRDVYQGEGRG